MKSNSCEFKLQFLLFVFAVSLGCFRSGQGIPEVTPDVVRERQIDRLAHTIVKFQEDHGPLPQIIDGVNGHKQSWRTLVAPYLWASRKNFDYRANEPWDSSHNQLELRNLIRGKFTCPFESQRVDYPYTSYVMIRRQNLDAKNPLPNNAVLVVESVNCGIELGEPKDMNIESLFTGDSPFGKGKLNSYDSEYVKAILADGRVIDIPKNITSGKLRKLLEGEY